MQADRELAQLRGLYYGVLTRLFTQEPTPQNLEPLLNGAEDRAHAAGKLNAAMGEGWLKMKEAVDAEGIENVIDEFTKLFLGPTRPKVTPYESQYLAGSLFQGPLVGVRQFMSIIGLERAESDYTEPEDVIGFELEIMNWMISRQLASEEEAQASEWILRQAQFLKGHLLIWGLDFAQDLEGVEETPFYNGVGSLLRGFLTWEKGLFDRIGPEKIESLEDARKRYGKIGVFKGPVFDPFSENDHQSGQDKLNAGGDKGNDGENGEKS